MRNTFLTFCIVFFALFAVHGTTHLHAQGDSVEVTASGSGTSKGTALTTAYANAVRQALEQAVDAGTMAQNEQTIQDQILPRSRMYIKQARAAGDSESNGVHTVTITATVDTNLILENLSTATAAATPEEPPQAPAQDHTPVQPAPTPVAAQPTPAAPVPVVPAPSTKVAETEPAQQFSLASPQNITEGFRGISWGAPLSTFHNSSEFNLDSKKPNWDIFTRKNDNMSFYKAQLSKIWYYANNDSGFFGVIIKTRPGFGKALIESVSKIMGNPTSQNIVAGDMQIFQSYFGGSSEDYEYIWSNNPIYIRIEHQIARANIDNPNSPDRNVSEMKIIFDPTIPSGGGF